MVKNVISSKSLYIGSDNTTANLEEILLKIMKPFEKLTFHDDFMFGHIMKNKEICKTVLEILLDMKIDRSKRTFRAIL